MAHEIRTPLTVIQGSLRAILDGVYPLSRDEITVVYEEALMASRLVTDLASLAAADAGHLTLLRRPVDLVTLLTEVAEVHSAAAREQDVRVVADSPDEAPGVTVDADPDRLRQILHNLVSNAVRYSTRGQSVRIRWLAEGPTSDPMVRIEVIDNGPGLSNADQRRVFDRLWRADPSRSREAGGSGLGLAIARSLVQAHGGEIGVVSEPGLGATFWFTVPVWKEKGAGASRP
jgi:two-component system OmpR family sensor kinase/two-component system sensor histidine kinase BaeS